MSAYDELLRELDEAGELDAVHAADKLAEHLACEDLAFLRELVALRRQAGLRQEDVALAWGRHKSAVCQFEKLGHDPRLSTIRRYAAAVGIRYNHYAELDPAVHARRAVFVECEFPIVKSTFGADEDTAAHASESLHVWA
ncbi:helix-turn-helix domain-containing protein [Mycobacterium intracellulare]|uniref:helix-turn-helix domain-containing protein n=1 Tax=Mycobacterium intracellulare TaxID=1767 RepID=UPI001EED9080|nr:helix-turn-helix transcriptional regulator [Mycobacterium intracellulare]MEE3755298.1 helix-turn-helix transcriptional regulator [Mycobacterium intracellulare]